MIAEKLIKAIKEDIDNRNHTLAPDIQILLLLDIRELLINIDKKFSEVKNKC